jgi:hypothetical protein
MITPELASYTQQTNLDVIYDYFARITLWI